MTGDALRIRQQSGIALRLRGREERVPDRPCIDRLAFERGARIGRREERRLNVGVIEAVLAQ